MSERVPHPKKLSVQAARDLHEGKIDVPDSEALRAASPHNPDIHDNEEEANKTKAERFAIEAHLIAQTTESLLKGEGFELRFVGVPDIERSVSGLHKLDLDLTDYAKSDLVKMNTQIVLEEPKNQAAIARLRQIQKQIKATTKNDSFSEDDIAAFRAESPSDTVVIDTIELIRQIKNHTKKDWTLSSAEKVRQIIFDNLDVLDDLASKNLKHNEGVITAPYEEYGTGETKLGQFEFSGGETKTELVKTNEKYKLNILNKSPKPKVGLTGATLGCPANYHLEEGDTALRKQAIAIINEAYDRGLLGYVGN